MASRYPALFQRELRALWDANPSPEVRRLLWEIARLQEQVTQVYDLLESLEGDHIDYTVGLGLTRMRNTLASEPAVKRMLTIRKREAARRAAESRPVIGTAMFPELVGPPWPWPPPRTPRNRRRA
jgi:hypothetical protein